MKVIMKVQLSKQRRPCGPLNTRNDDHNHSVKMKKKKYTKQKLNGNDTAIATLSMVDKSLVAHYNIPDGSRYQTKTSRFEQTRSREFTTSFSSKNNNNTITTITTRQFTITTTMMKRCLMSMKTLLMTT